MFTKNLRTITLSLIIVLNLTGVAPAQSYRPEIQTGARFLAATTTENYIIEGTGEGAACRDATPEELHALAVHDQVVPLHVITPVRESEINRQAGGLLIILWGTQQLENFPQAKSAFLRAAETWEGVIRNQITVLIDVDFGPTRFGVSYPSPTILGSTTPQLIGHDSAYLDIRSGLISNASSAEEAGLYNALPVGAIQTDVGSTSAMLAASAVIRALGIIGPVADPASETAALGPPPAIGFNSAFQFDFNPDDGIDAGKTDFDAVAVHEIGHALGFGSNVGKHELDPGTEVAPSMVDLFRFRPGVTLPTFPTARRIQSSGGAQVFFTGGAELALSTGRPDLSGGDGRQASHWKDDVLTGQYLGIMDPTITFGQRFTITDLDLLAFDAIGYQTGALEGDTTTLTSGVAQPGSVPAPNPGMAILSTMQYTIEVPGGASQLIVELDGNPDIDLYVRAGQRITLGPSGPVSDYVSNSQTGTESLTITASSSPPLLVGTYYIAVANYGPGPASFNVTATIAGGTGGNRVPVINSLQAELTDDVVTMTGVAADSDGDIVQAQASLLDQAGQVVGQTAPFDVSFGSSTAINFTLTVNNIKSVPAAMQVSLTLIDRRGNRSAAKTADFSGGDQGGATLSNASYNGSKLTIKGGGFANQVLLEVNGRVVSLSQSSGNRKLKVKGDSSRLNLRAGPNRLRVFNGNLRSNLFVLNF
jgi:hypothetical protein